MFEVQKQQKLEIVNHKNVSNECNGMQANNAKLGTTKITQCMGLSLYKLCKTVEDTFIWVALRH